LNKIRIPRLVTNSDARSRELFLRIHTCATSDL